MKHFLFFLSLSSMLYACSQKADLVSVKSGIDKSNQIFMDAVSKGDAETAASLYTDDTQLMPPNVPVLKGKDAAKNFFSESIKGGVSGIKLTSEEVNGTNDMAVESGKYELQVAGKTVDEGKYMVEWKKVGEMWLIRKDMFSSNIALGRMAAQKDQPVGVVVWKVKKGNDKKIEEFVRNTLMPSIDRTVPLNDQAVRAARFLSPTSPDKDGSTRYIFIFDPMIKDADYNMLNVLTTKHGKEKGLELYKNFQSLTSSSDFFEMKQSEL